MTRTISRRTAITVACISTVLAAPAGAMALTKHSATATIPNSDGTLVATAKCGAHEHVVSGGFKSPNASGSAAIVSRAVHGNSWTVVLYPEVPPLTTYAYCARKGGISIHKKTVTAKTGTTAPYPNTTATARCASAETVVSGGYVMSPTSATGANSPTYRDYASSARKWKVTSAFENPGSLEAFAYCERGVVIKVRSSTSAPIPPDNGDGSATARCHKGETLLSGGYTTKPKPDWENTFGPDFFYNSSYRSGKRSWTASAHNYSNVAGTITAFAYCKT
jgi:hypothetical protein